MLSDPFSAAVEARDPDALTEALAEGVSFRSPVVFRPYEGRPLVSTVLTEGAMKVFEDFRYTDKLEREGSAALVFNATVRGREVEGVDLLRFDEEGKVSELVVLVRPMSGLNALAGAMAERFEELGITPPRRDS
jgi:hypothetical protein